MAEATKRTAIVVNSSLSIKWRLAEGNLSPFPGCGRVAHEIPR